MDYSAHIFVLVLQTTARLHHVGRKNDDSGTGHDASPVHSSPLLRLNMYDELQSSPLAAVLAMYALCDCMRDNVRTPWASRPLHLAASSGLNPYRRSLDPKSSRAAARSSLEKSGHSRGVKYNSVHARSHSIKLLRRCSPPVLMRRSGSPTCMLAYASGEQLINCAEKTALRDAGAPRTMHVW